MTRIFRFAACLFVCAALFSCTNNPASVHNKPKGVYVAYPQASPSSASHSYTSTVEEGTSVNASFKTGGQIKRLGVKEGDYVRKGQTIAWLDDVDYRLSVGQLESQYEQMESEMKRLDEMFRRNNIAPNDYEKAKAGFAQLKAQLELTRNKLAYTRLEAPSSGYVVEKYMEAGEMAGAGTPVVRILDNSSLETSVALPAAIYTRRDEIAGCTATSAATGSRAIPLEIISFVPDADNNSLFRLRLRIPSSMHKVLVPGMNLTVEIAMQSGDADNVSMVPSRAIFDHNGSECVWVVNPADSTLSRREVKTVGAPVGDANLVAGLDGTEAIVAAGVRHLAEREKVAVLGDVSNLKK